MNNGFDDPVSLTLVPHGERTVLAGRFKLLRYVGAGSVGAVYEAYDANRSKKIAVKIFYPLLVDDVDARSRLLQTVKLNSSLSHPSIVSVYEAYEERGRLWVSMEWVDGESLAQMVESRQARNERFQVGEVCECMTGLLEILDGVSPDSSHLGLTPRNVFFDAQNGWRISDFGFQMCVERTRASLSSLVLSAVGYQAPEILQAVEVADSRADQYSVAAIAYHMLVGCPPQGTGPSLRQIRADVSSRLEACLSRALQAESDERYVSVRSFQTALHEANRPSRGWVLGLRVLSGLALAMGMWWLVALVLPDSFIGRRFHDWVSESSSDDASHSSAVMWDRTALGLDANARRVSDLEAWMDEAATQDASEVFQPFVESMESLRLWVRRSWSEEDQLAAAEGLAVGRRLLDQGHSLRAIETLKPILTSAAAAGEEWDQRFRFLRNAAEARDLAVGLSDLGVQRNVIRAWRNLMPSGASGTDQPGAVLLANLARFTDEAQSEARDLLDQAAASARAARDVFRQQAGPYVIPPKHMGDPDAWVREADAISRPLDWGRQQARYAQAADSWNRWLNELEALPASGEELVYENALGMRFVSLKPAVWISVFETRLMDYETFLQHSGYDSDRHWRRLTEGFVQSSITEPVVGIHAENARVFCRWLTDFDRQVGSLGSGQRYRLPDVSEWALAAGEFDSLDRRGETFPPRLAVLGNTMGSDDGYPWTAPVGSYEPNSLGLFDIVGNAAEWCGGGREDWGHFKFVRGVSWERNLCGSYPAEEKYPGTHRLAFDIGFRVVIESSNE